MSFQCPDRPLGACVDPLERRVLFSTIEFDPLVKYPAGPAGPGGDGPAHVAVGDFNRDGIEDLLAAGDMISPLTVEADWVRVLPGRGDGTFAPPLPATMAGDNISGVALADFNRDGRLDVAVSNRGGRGSVRVLTGRGDGTFGPQAAYFTGSQTTGVAAADFDRDGDVDLVASNANELAPLMSGASLLTNNGDGTFGDALFLPRAGPAHFVEAGDFNNDRIPDAVFGRVVVPFGDFAAPRSVVYTMVGLGDATFGAAQPVEVAGEITGLAVGDLTGDGRRDVALSVIHSYMQGAAAAVLAGRGDGTFAEIGRYSAGPIASDVVIADLNGDGRPDLAVSGDDPLSTAPFDRGHVIAFPNEGGGRMGQAVHVGFVGKPAGITAGALNRDRLPDLAVACPRSDEVGVLINDTKTLSAYGTPVSGIAGQPFVDRPVARFRVTGSPSDAPANPTGDDFVFAARIYWGDGGRSAGRVVRNQDGSFSVLGSHTYQRPGVYRILVLIEWPDAGLRQLVVSRAIVRAPVTRTA